MADSNYALQAHHLGISRHDAVQLCLGPIVNLRALQHADVRLDHILLALLLISAEQIRPLQ